MLMRVIIGVIPGQVLGESRPFRELAALMVAYCFPFVYVHIGDFLNLITIEAFEFYRPERSGHDVRAFENINDLTETHDSTSVSASTQ
jgi:hypothetical protein